MNYFRGVGEWLSSLTAGRRKDDNTFPTSSAAPPQVSFPSLKNPLKKINDSLYELQELKPHGPPNMVILFFQGRYWTDSPDKDLETWESDDESCIWPSTWVVEEFPDARILYVSYSIIPRIPPCYFKDELVENLASDFVQANIGQTPNCPVILVGHGFGGLVIKKLCLDLRYYSTSALIDSEERIGYKTFLAGLKGVFFYGTPHRGSPWIDTLSCFDNYLFRYFKFLSEDASRLHSDFSSLCSSRPSWKIHGLVESWPTYKGVLDSVEHALEESSFNVVTADHISISKPTSKKDRRFYALTTLLHSIVKDKEEELLGHQCQGLPDYPVALEERARDVQEALKDAAILGICGMGGIGKTTLAKQVFNYISKDFEYTCFFDNVKDIQPLSLEQNILGHFHKSGRKVESTQWQDMKEKRALIVMDDIDSEEQLRVLPNLEHFKSVAGSSSQLVTKRLYSF